MLNQNVLNIHSYIVVINYMEGEQQQKQQQQQECGGGQVNDADAYVSQMSPFELSAYRIAKGHLGTSFNLKKSNGFLKWISARR
jgi:hypothetical protein